MNIVRGLRQACTGWRLLLFVVGIALSGTVAAQEYFDNVVIVLDASGSMSSAMSGTKVQKMDAAKDALKKVLTQVPQTTHIGLLVFSGRNVPDKWLYPLGPRNDAALIKAINQPQPGGNTPLGQFIKIGADRLLEERAKQFGYGSYRLIVVTDGEATDGPLTDKYTPEIVARGITVDAIGVDMKQTHTLATKVHSYRRADDPQGLTRALAEILGEVTKSDSDAASKEAFDLLAPIPPELGAAMLDALSHAKNQPIGTTVAAAPVSVPDKPGAPGQANPNKNPRNQARQKDTSRVFLAIVVTLVVVVVVISRLARSGSRR